MNSARAQLAAITAGFVVLAVVLAYFPPAQYAFYPQCPIHELLGWQCPGCGMTRALACLVAGRIREAAGYNALSIVAVPAALLQGYFALRRDSWLAVGHGWIAFACAVVFAFGVIRNLSW